MSARDRLFDHLWWDVPSSDDAEAKINANQMIDAFAHELAEQIRKAYSGDVMDASWVTNPYDSADLIDPEVEK